MTAAELMEKLSRLPRDTEILICGHGCGDLDCRSYEEEPGVLVRVTDPDGAQKVMFVHPEEVR